MTFPSNYQTRNNQLTLTENIFPSNYCCRRKTTTFRKNCHSIAQNIFLYESVAQKECIIKKENTLIGN